MWEIADAFDIPKSEVGRIARRVRPLCADESAGPAAELGNHHRRAQQLNKLWNGPGAEPLPGTSLWPALKSIRTSRCDFICWSR